MIEALGHSDYGKRNQVYERLYTSTEELRELAQFDLCLADGDCLYSTGLGMYHASLPVYWGALRSASMQIGKTVFCREMDTDGNSYFLRIARTVTDEDSRVVGFLAASVKKENLVLFCEQNCFSSCCL